MCIEMGDGRVGCIWANVGFCRDLVVRGVDVVANGGHEGCFVVVGGDLVGALWWVGEFRVCGKVDGMGQVLWGR
jgi:hypothetical protein